jgi:exoribonuclease II
MVEYIPISRRQANSLYARNAQGLIFNMYTCDENRFIWRAENEIIKIGVSQDKHTPKSNEPLKFKAPKTLNELIERFNLTILNKITSESYSYQPMERALDEVDRAIRKHKN